MMGTDHQIKVGFIGFGRMAEYHADFLLATNKFILKAVSDPTPQRREVAGTKYGMKAFDHTPAMLESDVELVFVTTHSSTHHDLTIESLNAGKHVVVEKPMSMDDQEAADMVAAAERNKKMLTVYHNRRWDEDYTRVKKAVLDGVLGELIQVENRSAGSRPAVGFGVKEFKQDWRITKSMGGGTLNDFGPHWTDQVLDLLDGQKVTHILADVRNIKWGDADDLFNIHMIFDGGTRATITKYDISYVPLPKWTIIGKNGSLHCEHNEPLIRTEKTAYFQLEGVPKPNLHENYHAHLTSGQPLIVTPRQALRVMQVLSAARRSAQAGRGIDVAI